MKYKKSLVVSCLISATFSFSMYEEKKEYERHVGSGIRYTFINKSGESRSRSVSPFREFRVSRRLRKSRSNARINEMPRRNNTKYGNLPIHQAILSGNIKKIRELSKDIFKKTTGGNQTVLHLLMLPNILNYGVIRKKVATTIFDLIKHFDLDKKKKLIDAESCGGEYALHTAIGRGFVDIAQMLIDNGADVTLICKGMSCLHRVLITSKIKKSNKRKLIGKILQALQGDFFRKKAPFINRKISKKYSRYNGMSALDIAMGKGYIDIVKALIGMGANITTRIHGKSFLHELIEQRHYGLLSWTLDYCIEQDLFPSYIDDLLESMCTLTLLTVEINDLVQNIIQKLRCLKWGLYEKQREEDRNIQYCEIVLYKLLKQADYDSFAKALMDCKKEDILHVDYLLEYIIDLTESAIPIDLAQAIVKRLLQLGVSLIKLDSEGKNVIHKLILQGQHRLLQTVIEYASEKNDFWKAFSQRYKGRTPVEMVLFGQCNYSFRCASIIIYTKNCTYNQTLLEYVQEKGLDIELSLLTLRDTYAIFSTFE